MQGDRYYIRHKVYGWRQSAGETPAHAKRAIREAVEFLNTNDNPRSKEWRAMPSDFTIERERTTLTVLDHNGREVPDAR